MGAAEIEILFLAGIAAFIGYRIYTVLGRRTGNEPPPVSRRESIEPRRQSSSKGEDNVIALPRAREAAPVRPVSMRSAATILTSMPMPSSREPKWRMR